MSNLIPITRIYDIFPKYTYSKDVKRFMDDIVDIPRAEVYTKDEVISMFKDIKEDIDYKYGYCDICEYFEDYDYDENDISEYRSVGSVEDITHIIQNKINKII